MNLVQFKTRDGDRRVARVSEGGTTLEVLSNTESVYRLALEAIAARSKLADMVESRLDGQAEDYDTAVAEKRLLPPIDHPDAAHCLVTGTGLTHLGSAESRDQMHRKAEQEGEDALSDSMKMFKWGLDGGKPASGGVGVQPEWFHKGDGSVVAAPEHPMSMPAFAEDGGEEPEVAGLYVIDPKGNPWRVGYALGNEFSDHVMERRNYLYLAHSKLRCCSFGPELLLGPLPGHVEGTSRILREGKVLWEMGFVSGEDNMSHFLAGLEHHHFKYWQHRRPGDVHVHFFGTASLSFTAGIKAESGDVFEISAPVFGRPLRNALFVSAEEDVTVGAL